MSASPGRLHRISASPRCRTVRAVNTTSTGTGTHSVTATYPALSSTAQWQFAQTGNLVFATQANAVLQVFDLSSATDLRDALGIAAAGGLYQRGRPVPGAVRAAVDALSDPVVGAEQLQCSDELDQRRQLVRLPGFSRRRHCPRRRRRRGRDHLSGSGDPAHVLCAGFADHLPDRPHHPGQGPVCALLDHPGRRAHLLLCGPGLSQDRAGRRARADRTGEGRPHFPGRSRQGQSATLHGRGRSAKHAGLLGLQIRLRHDRDLRQAARL